MTRSNSKKIKQKVGGPYLASAVFCDNVVRGEDGAMTAVRMIDHITVGIPADAPPDVPSEDKQVLTEIQGLIGFKKGGSGTKHRLKLRMTGPSGKSKVLYDQDAEFRSEPQSGYNLRLKATIAVAEVGMYWLDVILDRKVMTRMPLLISVKRADTPPVEQPTDKKKKPAKTGK